MRTNKASKPRMIDTRQLLDEVSAHKQARSLAQVTEALRLAREVLRVAKHPQHVSQLRHAIDPLVIAKELLGAVMDDPDL